ncbi:MAG: hypothetical protein ACE5MH_01790 [Terriglobia bacterium]
MSAPETISVRLTEEVAGYVDTRPVLAQRFRLHELVDMILATTGKNASRITEILRSGTCTYNTYRYWWDGFVLEADALAAVLAEFPDPDPARPFRPEACTWVLLASVEEPIPHTLTLDRATASRRRWFRRESFWDFLLQLAQMKSPAYRDYSYYHRGDLFACALATRELALLDLQAARLGPRGLRQQLARVAWQRMELFCPRRKEAS